MPNNAHFSGTLRFLIGAAAIGIAVVTVQPYAWLLNSVFLGVLIVVIAAPMLYWLGRRGLPGWLALLITLLVLAVIAVALVLFSLASVNRLVEALPRYLAEAESLKETVGSELERLGVNQSNIQALLTLINPRQLLELVAGILAELADVIHNVVIVVLVVAFLLAETMGLSAKTKKQLSLGEARLARVDQLIHDLRRYISITAWLAAATGATVTFLLLILGVDFPLLWGMLTFFLSFIPTVGIFLAMIPPALLALLEFGLAKALIVVAGFLLIDALVENVAKPKYLGEGLDLAPAVVILSLIFWAAVLGPFGALLAVPLTLAFKELVLEADDRNRWLAALMSGGEHTRPQKVQEINPGESV